ncbi:MAG: helix-turn-helix domain-containing protein [Spirochaetaceae bacterium]|jgi:repressor LexA|nr:helix-turn-helix domain-containing protein [Spirochaetaceae bacterium]
MTGRELVERIDSELAKRGEKRPELARAVGLSTQAFTNWYKKGNFPNANTALNIAEYLGVSVYWLITGIDETGLSPCERELLNKYRVLDVRGKRTAMAIIDTLIKEQTGYADMEQAEAFTVHEPEPAYGSAENFPQAANIRYQDPPILDDNIASIVDIFPVPYYGKTAAGKPINIEAQPGQWLPVPEELLKGNKSEFFAVKIKGRSMTEANILNDDFVVMRRAEAPENNKIMLVRYGNESTVKRIKILDDQRVLLCWEDGSGTTKLVDSADYEIQGEYVFTLRK